MRRWDMQTARELARPRWQGWAARALVAALVCTGAASGVWAQCASSNVELISVASDGTQAQGRNELPSVNADGCVVAFKSNASNLVPSGGNGLIDVFRHDRISGVTERIPPRAVGTADPDGNSFPPGLDATGRFVALGSLASNLLRGDFNQSPDLFVFDEILQSIDVLTLLNEGRGGGLVPDLAPSMSADGCVVAFSSGADLTANDSNGLSDVFVHASPRDPVSGACDRASGTLELISVATFGGETGRSSTSGSSIAATISADGCIVAFYSDAHLALGGSEGTCDVLVRNRCDLSQPTERIAQVSHGACAATPQSLPALSGDGRFVAFATDPAFDGGNVYVRDRQSLPLIRVSLTPDGLDPNGASGFPSLSYDGRFIVFQSSASDLVANDTNNSSDIFALDLANPERQGLVRVSVTANGDEVHGNSLTPQISADGGTVVFQSSASDLVENDTNGQPDIFAIANPINVPIATPTGVATTPPGASVTPTQNPTGTPTPTLLVTPTVTATTATAGTATPSASATATGNATTSTTPGAPTPTQPSGTRTRTPTQTASTSASPTAGGSGGGGGGGCSCRIDSGAPPSGQGATVLGLLVPLALVLRRCVRRTGRV